MAWLKIDQNFYRHPKLIRLSKALNVEVPQAAGHLIFLWQWALEYSPSGDLSQFSADEIADAVRWAGDYGTLISGLKKCGWVDDDDMIHDWQDYAGPYLKSKSDSKNRQEKFRLSRKSNALLTRYIAVSNAARTVPYRTVPEEKETLEVRAVDHAPQPPTSTQRLEASLSLSFREAKNCWKEAMRQLKRSTIINTADEEGFRFVAKGLENKEYSARQLVSAFRQFQIDKGANKSLANWGVKAFYDHKADWLRPEMTRASPTIDDSSPGAVPATPEETKAAIAKGKAEYERAKNTTRQNHGPP